VSSITGAISAVRSASNSAGVLNPCRSYSIFFLLYSDLIAAASLRSFLTRRMSSAAAPVFFQQITFRVIEIHNIRQAEY
jgi:hypothetical protein